MGDETIERGRDAWRPNPGPQTAFLQCGAFEALYGGAAGGGKSDALLMGATRHATHPDYRAVIFRRTGPELEKAKGLVERAWSYYPPLGATAMRGGRLWRFPSGATIELAAMEHEADRHKWNGPEFQYIGLDEGTGFLRSQYLHLISRLRSAAAIPVRIRMASNPGGVGHEWCLERWAPWLYPLGATEYDGPRAGPGERLFYLTADGEEIERVVPRGTPGATSRTFFPARVDDTPQLAGTGYKDRLALLDPLTRRQLRDGDWTARPEAGLMFRREWFSFVNAPPHFVKSRVRYWDRAATERTATNDPAATAGVRISIDRDDWITVEDVVRLQGRPGDVARAVLETAERDRDAFGVGGCTTVIEQDPGQAGVFEVDAYRKILQGFSWGTALPRGDKVERAKPFSAQADPASCGAGSPTGAVRIVRGGWNALYLAELVNFPTGKHKDQVDASSGAYGECVRRMSLVGGIVNRRRDGGTTTRETAKHRGGY